VSTASRVVPGTSLTINELTGHAATASGNVDLRGTLNKAGDGALTLTGKIYDNSLSDPPGAIGVQGGTLTLELGDGQRSRRRS
jgi:autotransporter translocation and assembly factor TamB